MALGIHPNEYPITGGYPFLNIAMWCKVPYALVLTYADECNKAWSAWSRSNLTHRIGPAWPESDVLSPSVCSAIQDWTVVEWRRKHGVLGTSMARA